MTCSPRPGMQLEPGQSVAVLAAASAQVAAPVILGGSPTQLDSTDVFCASPRGSKGDASTHETEDSRPLSRTSDTASSRDGSASKKLARPLLSPSASGHRAPDDNPYMP